MSMVVIVRYLSSEHQLLYTMPWGPDFEKYDELDCFNTYWEESYRNEE